MDDDIDLKELQQYLSLVNDKTRKNLGISSLQDYQALYHISLYTQTTLTPNISRRAAPKEDNTIPRVHVSPYLLGALLSIGYVSYYAYTKPKDIHYKKYKGGFYIHQINADTQTKVLIPNKTLVYDAQTTHERWLVPYSPMHRDYPVDIIGKVFTTRLEYIPEAGKPPAEHITMMLESTHENGVHLTDRIHFQKGHYEFTYSNTQAKVLSYHPIDANTYKQAKMLSASLLNYQEMPAVESIRPFMSW